MSDSIFIQHRFTAQKDGLTLQDAIVLPQAEYEALSPQDIEAMKRERLDTFVESVKHPVAQPEPTKAEKIATIDKDLASLEEQRVALVSLKAEVNKK